jgi:hypothetical protein
MFKLFCLNACAGEFNSKKYTKAPVYKFILCSRCGSGALIKIAELKREKMKSILAASGRADTHAGRVKTMSNYTLHTAAPNGRII